jgi:hypothetical protein
MARWEVLRDNWKRSMRANQQFRLVAKNNLYGALRGGKSLFDYLIDSGQLEVCERDDERILALAMEREAVVISGDRYVDFRHPRDWSVEYEGKLNAIRVFGWRRQGSRILFSEDSLAKLRSAVITKRRIEQLAKENGLADEDLMVRWICDDQSCAGGVHDLPRRSGDGRAFVCPLCGGYMARGDRLTNPVWLKVIHGRGVNHFVLEDDDELLLGRHVIRNALAGTDTAFLADVKKVSERHLRLLNREGVIHFEDLGSRNGTRLVHAARGALDRWLPPGPRVNEGVLSERVRLQLGGVAIFVEFSGRGMA